MIATRHTALVTGGTRGIGAAIRDGLDAAPQRRARQPPPEHLDVGKLRHPHGGRLRDAPVPPCPKEGGATGMPGTGGCVLPPPGLVTIRTGDP